MVAQTTFDPIALVRRRASETGDASYGDVVARFPFGYYEARVQELGFAGLGRVLDVGCGFGHWTAALARVNDEATGLDQSASRVAIAAEVASALALENVHAVVGDANVLPFPDASFDGLFCYGVFMFLDRDAALEEFRRVLKPGGRLYVCTNAAGWWLRLWLQSLRGNPDVRKYAFRGWARGRSSRPPHAVSRRRAQRLLDRGFADVEAGLEGRLGLLDPDSAETPYAGSWLGLDSVIEFTATKLPGVPSERRVVHDPTVEADIDRLVEATASRRTYEYSTPLDRHPQPRPAHDIVNNSDPAVVRGALGRARLVDRRKVMEAVYRRITEGQATEDQRVVAAVTFAQKHFFHHFAGQPMMEGALLVDPVALLLLEQGRCGASARFLVDLFRCNGVPARLVGGACHTWAEVLCDGRWVIADANLFPPGVLPRNDERGLLSLDDAIAQPDLLNRTPSFVNYHGEFVDDFLARYPETAGELERWLRAPLLPSAAYFGDAFFSAAGRVAGRLERYSKSGDPEEWVRDGDFGWGAVERETVDAPVVPVEQRPSQVASASRDGDRLAWTPAVPGAPGRDVRYRVICSQVSRGWEFDSLPVGCTFDAPGEAVVVDTPSIDVREVRGRGEFVTVLAENSDWSSREIFYLPSREFVVTSR